VPRFTFFIGKGGVGKTTVSSAYALNHAARHQRERVLLLSTDPAHSLADVLQGSQVSVQTRDANPSAGSGQALGHKALKLSDRVKRLSSAGQLWARQIDPDRQIQKFLTREREDILVLLNKGSLFTRDELAPLLDTSLPGMAEVAALLAIHELLDSDYDEVVVDTAPMGHAIRLFQMPEHFARFLDVLETAASRDVVLAQHFGGHVQREPALDRWARMVERVEEALSAEGSQLVLVTTPEPFSLNEAARSAAGFQSGDTQNHIAEIVLNRVVQGKTSCPPCKRRAKQSVTARQFLRRHFPQAKVFTAEDPGCPILGLAALQSFGAHIFQARRLARSAIAKAPKSVTLEVSPAVWPQLETSLTLTVGKGGVGKTTISAALAFHHRKMQKSDTVTICSIDPAPSLDDVFAAKVGDTPKPVLRDPKLLAAEFDALAQFKQWSAQLRARLNDAMTGEKRGVHLDLSLDRRFLLALLDIVPPGVDEIFAIFRILDLLRSGGRVVIDMAPTGHALEVLRTPDRLLAWARVLLKTLAAHRTLAIAQDAAVEIAALSQKVRELASMLRDAKQCRLVLVTLAEPLPDYETRRLLRALNELKAPLGAVFVNRVLIGDGGRCSRCKLAAQWQAASLSSLRRQLRGSEILVAREFDEPIAGAKQLQQFTREIWRYVHKFL
jgi:arsenite-transporting ATPase